MKKLLTLFLLMLCGFMTTISAQDRYLDDLFDVQVTNDINYSNNITVLTVADPDIAAPTLQALNLDFYEPMGDTETARPLVIVFHTGNFLPQGTNGGVSGTRQDEPIVAIANRLAAKGYVVAVADYRQGWNPVSTNINERVGTLINASYRGIQDANTCVRFFRSDVAGANLYGVDPNRITLWGVGTGGYVSTAAGAIDNYSELVLPKFIDSDTGVPMVLEQLSGDPQGTVEAPLNVPNHVGFDSKAQLVVNMGGALGDTSWLTANDPAYINFQCPNDPFAPYMEDILIVPTTGDLIVEVQGSYTIQEKAATVGLDDVFNGHAFDVADITTPTDQIVNATPFSVSANSLNDGYEGLFPLDRPCVPSIITGEGEFCEASPWDWWNSAFWSTVPHPSCPEGVPLELCNFDVIARLNNNDASEEKGNIYLDSIMGYFAPRACVALDLPCADFFAINVGVNDVIDAELSIMPNPAKDRVMFTTSEITPIQNIAIYTIDGSLVKEVNNIQATQYQLNRGDIPTGMYFAKVQFKEGIMSKKIMFE